MTAGQVLQKLRDYRIEIRAVGDQVVCTPAAIPISDDLASAIRRHKPALLSVLRMRVAVEDYPACEVWLRPEDWLGTGFLSRS